MFAVLSLHTHKPVCFLHPFMFTFHHSVYITAVSVYHLGGNNVLMRVLLLFVPQTLNSQWKVNSACTRRRWTWLTSTARPSSTRRPTDNWRRSGSSWGRGSRIRMSHQHTLLLMLGISSGRRLWWHLARPGLCSETQLPSTSRSATNCQYQSVVMWLVTPAQVIVMMIFALLVGVIYFDLDGKTLSENTLHNVISDRYAP